MLLRDLSRKFFVAKVFSYTVYTGGYGVITHLEVSSSFLLYCLQSFLGKKDTQQLSNKSVFNTTATGRMVNVKQTTHTDDTQVFILLSRGKDYSETHDRDN